MKTHTILWPLLAFLVSFFPACRSAETKSIDYDPRNDDTVRDYWFAGVAELTGYELEQARYGEIRKGDAVLIFVTEDFLTEKQVKLEDYSKGKTGSVPVLKLNAMKTFNTGIYPYSMMQSVFSPMDIREYPHALKAASTVVEWCGQSFSQINLQETGYRITQHSYFEKEGDRVYDVGKAWLEDEIWTLIRIAPESLPQGDVRMIPAMMAARLRHIPLEVETATATIGETADGAVVYSIRYPKTDRELSITFNKSFPHEIYSWEETYLDGWGKNARKLTTRATRKKTLKTDYWNHNGNSDEPMRKELGLK